MASRSNNPLLSFGRRPLVLIALAAAAALMLSGCAATSDDQQQDQEQQQAVQQEQTATAESSSAGTTASGSTTATSPQRSTTAAAEPAEQQQQQQMAAETAQEQQSQADTMQEQPQDDDGMGGMSPGMSVGILTEANYDDLSPRLQLLRDSGYPVYVSEQGYTISLGTPDLSPGIHRISFVIEGPDGLVESPAMRITVVPADAPGEMQEVVARFSRFPDGIRGFHVTAVDFAAVGRWNLILHIPTADGFTDIGVAVDIPVDTLAPSIGDAAPPSASRTLLDVPNISDLSTGEEPDPGLYIISLADALEADKPFVVVFASPGFCTNAFCGPQAEVLSEVRTIFGDQANYIHVDLYENPEQVRFGEEPIETPILEEWGLHTDEWTFVVNAEGIVVARFEAFAPLAEVEAALAAVLEG
ncbi:MAG: hypothetical protein OXN86_12735 [Chloroflexota bacterium]|nr:hypothetical protein [Chloroflexota bacterium]